MNLVIMSIFIGGIGCMVLAIFYVARSAWLTCDTESWGREATHWGYWFLVIMFFVQTNMFLSLLLLVYITGKIIASNEEKELLLRERIWLHMHRRLSLSILLASVCVLLAQTALYHWDSGAYIRQLTALILLCVVLPSGISAYVQIRDGRSGEHK